MKTILILRHAKSDWNNTQLSDMDRPLSPRGLKSAPKMGKVLADPKLQPDIILTSPAKRALQTAELVIQASGYDGRTQPQESFYYGGSSDMLAALRNLPDTINRPLIIGHNPTLAEVVGIICHNQSPVDFTAKIRLPTTGLVCVDVHISEWSRLNPGDGVLRWFLIPKLLKALG